MEEQKEKSIYKIQGLIKFQGVEFLSSVDSASKDAAKRFEESRDTSKAIAKNIKSIARTEEKINKSEERESETLERQRNFIERTETGVAPVTRLFGGIFKKAIQKPINVLQKLLLGLLIKNIPLIINVARDTFNKARLILAQVKELGSTVYNVFNNTWNIINAMYQNVLDWDFTDKSKRVEGAINQLETDFKQDREDLDALSQAWDLDRKELEALLDRLKAGEDPRSAAQPQSTITGRPNGDGATVNGTAEEYRIAAAIATEAGRGVSATDVLQVAANRSADTGDSFTEVFAAPNQFQGVELKGVEEYRNIRTAEDAAAWSGRSVSDINGYISDLRNPTFRADSAKEIGGAKGFRAAPSFYQDNPGERPAGTGSDGRIPGSSWRGGSGDNQILRDASKGDPMRAGGAAPINYAQGGTTSPSGTPSTFTGSLAETEVIDELDVATNKSPLGGLTPGQGFGAPRDGGSRSHQGLDIGPYGARGFKVALRAAGVVARVGNDRNGYGKFVIIEVPSMGKSFMFAHLANTTVKQGDNYVGGAIGEIGDTGNSPGSIHLHFEVYQGGANGKAIDPDPYRYLLSIGRTIRTNTQIASKLSVNNVELSKNKNKMIAGLYYDHEAAEENNRIVIVTKPVVATKNTVINNYIPTGGSTKIVGGGGGSSSKSFNDAFMSTLA